MVTNIELGAGTALVIEGRTEPVIVKYFETLNLGDFTATANLFAAQGAMHPPFENAVVGAAAIAIYLHKEAQGIKLQPQQSVRQSLEDGNTEFKVTGKVQMPWCGVKVSWLFVINAEQEILSVAIELLASPQELLNLRRP